MPPVYETYRGIKIYVLEDMETREKFIQFDWYGRVQDALEEEYEAPTLKNKLNGARRVIDLLFTMKEQGLIDENGYVLKKEE